ncbi:hypothetical protein Tco_0276212 [Tanacetum coccineum]
MGWVSPLKYVVPTGRVVVPTGRYIVPASKVIIIVSTGRLSSVPTGRVLSPGSKDLSRVGSNKWYQSLLRVSHKKNIPGFKILINLTTKHLFIPLKWQDLAMIAMMKVIQKGNSLKRTRRDCDRRVIILPPTTADEHITVQRESKARTTLLQSIPGDHVADFHYMDDARDIWNAVKARFGENAESKKMRKSMLKQEFLELRVGDAGEFALMGVTSEVHNCSFGYDNKYNELQK